MHRLCRHGHGGVELGMELSLFQAGGMGAARLRVLYQPQPDGRVPADRGCPVLGIIRRGFIGKRWLYVLSGVAAFTVLCYCLLFLSASRGGLVFLAIGCLLWLAGLGGYRSRSLIAVGILIAVVIGFSFLRSDSVLMERLLGPSGQAVKTEQADWIKEIKDRPVKSDPRIGIWLDTLGMIREQPLAGSGLGSYPFVYQYHAKRSFSEMTALHAESSWLTLAAEAGVPALLAVLGCLAFLISGIPRLERLSGRDWPLRWGFAWQFSPSCCTGSWTSPCTSPNWDGGSSCWEGSDSLLLRRPPCPIAWGSELGSSGW